MAEGLPCPSGPSPRDAAPSSWNDLVVVALLVLGAALFLVVPVIQGLSLDPRGYWWSIGPFRREPGRTEQLRLNWVLYDHTMQFTPWRLHAAERIRQGEAPLWNWTIYSGAPFLGNGQSALCYPPEWAFFALDSVAAANFLVLWFHLSLALVGTYWLARSWDLSRPASIAASVSFAASGYVMSGLGGPVGSVACWLGVVLATTDRCIVRPGRGSALLLALAIAFSILAGHHQMSAVLLGTASCYALWEGLASVRRRDRRPGGAAWFTVGCGLVAGVLLASIHWVPSMEYLFHSEGARERFIRAENEYTLPVSASIHLLSPRILGIPTRSEYLGQLHFRDSVAIYAGGLMFALALAGATSRAERATTRHASRPRTFLVLLWIGSAVAVFGLPGIARLAAHVPLVGSLRLYYLSLPLALSTSLLGGMGIDRWYCRRRSRGLALFLAVGASLCLAPLAVRMAVPGWSHRVVESAAGRLADRAARSGAMHLSREEILLRASRLLEPPWGVWDLAWVGAALAGASILLWGEGRRVLRVSGVVCLVVGESSLSWLGFHAYPPPGPFSDPPRFLTELRRRAEGVRTLAISDFPPTVATAYGFREVRGYDALMPATWSSYLALVDPDHTGTFSNFDLRVVESPWLDVAAVGWVWSDVSLAGRAGLVEEFEFRGYHLYRRSGALARARIVQGTVEVASRNQAERAMARGDLDSIGQVVWVAREGVEAPGGSGSGSCRITMDKPERIVIRTRTEGTCWLVLADQSFPGWLCSVDGEEVAIETVNLCFRGVILPPGDHEVEFRYRPRSVLVGAALSLLAALALLVPAALGGLFRRGLDPS